MGFDQIRQFVHRFKGYFTNLAGTPPQVSAPNTAYVIYDADQQALLKSENGAVYGPIGAPSSAALLQAAWFVDSINGSDANDGATAGTALATLREYTRRIGIGTVPNFQQVTLLTDIAPGTESVITSGNYRGGLLVQGTRTVIRSGTITGLQVYTPAADLDGLLTDAGVASWLPDVDRMIVLTSGANSGAIAWVAADPAGGSSTCRYSPFFNPNTFAVVDPSITDTYDVVELTQINGNLVSNHAGFLQYQDVHVDDTSFFGAIRLLTGQTQMNFCRITSLGGDFVGAGIESNAGFTGCNMDLPFFELAGPAQMFMSANLSRTVHRVLGGGYYRIGEDCLWQGSEAVRVEANGLLAVTTADFIAVWDMPGAADICIELRVGGFAFVTGEVFGANNDGATAIGLLVDSGAILTYNGSMVDRFRLTGATLTEVNIAGDATPTYAGIGVAGTNGLNTVRLAAIVPGTFGP